MPDINSIDLITQIIDAVKKIARFNNDISFINKISPLIELEPVENGYNISSISWCYYDNIYVTNTKLTFSPEFGQNKTILTYNGWHDLIEKTK